MSTKDLESFHDDETVLRRNSELLVREAILQKQAELQKYGKVIELYGAKYDIINNKMNTIDEKTSFTTPTSSRKNESVNKILETRHNLNIENKILNIFIILFTIFIIFEFSLISILKFDIYLSSWLSSISELVDYQCIFQYGYLIILIMGKLITYLFLITFFIRIYVGLKVFSSSVNTKILLKLINIQFMGFLNSSLMSMGIIALDCLFKVMLTRLELVEEDDYMFKDVLVIVQRWMGGVDIVLYATIFIGLVLSGLRKVIKRE